jgi:hypothetical protein
VQLGKWKQLLESRNSDSTGEKKAIKKPLKKVYMQTTKVGL